MSEDRPSKPDEERAADPDSRLGARRTEDPRSPEGDQPNNPEARVHVDDRDLERVPPPKDNTGVSTS
jgi:hypothetical protein